MEPNETQVGPSWEPVGIRIAAFSRDRTQSPDRDCIYNTPEFCYETDLYIPGSDLYFVIKMSGPLFDLNVATQDGEIFCQASKLSWESYAAIHRSSIMIMTPGQKEKILKLMKDFKQE